MRKKLIFACVTVSAASLYLSWVYYSRWRDNQALIRRLEAPGEARSRAFVEAYGEGNIKILSFYAAPSIIRLGETAQLCYGVANADSVHIQPQPQADIWPSLSRCITVSPSKDTAYRLIAQDNRGNEKAAALTIAVLPK